MARSIDRYNRIRRHSSCEMRCPIDYQAILAARAASEAPARRRRENQPLTASYRAGSDHGRYEGAGNERLHHPFGSLHALGEAQSREHNRSTAVERVVVPVAPER